MRAQTLKLLSLSPQLHAALNETLAERGIAAVQFRQGDCFGLEGSAELYDAWLQTVRRLDKGDRRTGHIEAWPSVLLGQRALPMYERAVRCLCLDGDFAECGVYRGETARDLLRLVKLSGIRKTVHLFDTFSGFPDVFTEEERAMRGGDDPWWLDRTPGGLAAGEEEVRQHIGGIGPYRLHVGLFSDTFPQFDAPLAFIHADADLYASTVEIIELADRLLVEGGEVVFDDYGSPQFPGVKRAVDECLDLDRYDLSAHSVHPQALATKRQ